MILSSTIAVNTVFGAIQISINTNGDVDYDISGLVPAMAEAALNANTPVKECSLYDGVQRMFYTLSPSLNEITASLMAELYRTFHQKEVDALSEKIKHLEDTNVV